MRDLSIEKVLNDSPHLAWEYKAELPLSQIDLKESLHNQARIEDPQNVDLVRQYTASKKQGDDFPAIVVYESKPGAYVLVDGIHRTSADIKLKRTTTDAYIIITDDFQERSLLTFALNTMNGRPTSPEDRAAHAVLLGAQGLPRAEIASRLNISIAQVDDAIHDRAGLLRAQNVGVHSAWTKIESRTSRIRLSNGLTLDQVFSLTVQWAGKYQPGIKEVTQIVRELREFSSEDDQLSYIRNIISIAEARAKGGSKNPGPGRTVMFRAHLAYLTQNIDGVEAIVKAMIPEERVSLRKSILEVDEGLKKTVALIDSL